MNSRIECRKMEVQNTSLSVRVTQDQFRTRGRDGLIRCTTRL